VEGFVAVTEAEANLLDVVYVGAPGNSAPPGASSHGSGESVLKTPDGKELKVSFQTAIGSQPSPAVSLFARFKSKPSEIFFGGSRGPIFGRKV
jgi:hypothetical protein